MNNREDNNLNSLGNSNTNNADSNINTEANNIFKFIYNKKGPT